MKIAVAYENGNVFEHFGHSRQFKIYETDGQNIVKEEVIESEGSGHSAMAGLLAGLDINAVICGGIGGGAANALGEAGIEVYSGVSGNADEALEAYLNGELISEGVNSTPQGSAVGTVLGWPAGEAVWTGREGYMTLLLFLCPVILAAVFDKR